MESIFTNPGYALIAENIFQHLDFEDLVAVGEKGGCELINKLCHEILKNSIFWLKKWTKNGLTKTDKLEWIRILDLAKITKQEDRSEIHQTSDSKRTFCFSPMLYG